MASGGKIFGLPCVAVGGCGWCSPSYGWSWMVVGGLSISLIFMEKVKSFTAFLTLNVSRERARERERESERERENTLSSKKSKYSGLDW